MAGNADRVGMGGTALHCFDPRNSGGAGEMPDMRVETSVRSVVAETVASLPQWGGPHNLLASPQGDGTRLSEATILRLVEDALT